MRSMRFILSGLILLGGSGFPWCCMASEFRVETDVFVNGARDPAVQTRTIFAEGVVYDFLLTGAQEITVFDRSRNRLVLLDPQRKVKTQLSLDGDILTYVAEMKAQLAEGNREFLLGEQMKTTEEADGWIALSNGRMTYRAEGITPKTAEMAGEYQQFADWYARLNAMRQGNPPPFARIRLNAALASRGLVPKTIERTIVQKHGLTDRKQVLRSQHLANWCLSQTDRKQIDRVGACLADFTDVTVREYFRLPDATPDTAP